MRYLKSTLIEAGMLVSGHQAQTIHLVSKTMIMLYSLSRRMPLRMHPLCTFNATFLSAGLISCPARFHHNKQPSEVECEKIN
jgi:hypothetical protein